MRKVLSTIAASATIVATLTLTPSLHADAGVWSRYHCWDNYVCAFNNAGWGEFLETRKTGLGISNLQRQDETSSWGNGSWGYAAWYQNTNGNGECHTMLPRSAEDRIPWSDNDELSSWRTNHGC